MLAHTWLSQEPLFLDTETTGLDAAAEVLEIGLVDALGRIVYETRLKPTVSISPEATTVHGIDDTALVDAPCWPDVAERLQSHIGQRPLVIFNAGFDMHILRQTAAAHNDAADWLGSLTTHCAMLLSAGYFGATNRYGTISLANAVSQAGLVWTGQAHSAVTDAVMTAQVVNAIAEYYSQLQCEMREF